MKSKTGVKWKVILVTSSAGQKVMEEETIVICYFEFVQYI